MKDEKKYSDCVDVLDQLETWTQEIYSAAGLCSAKPQTNVDEILTLVNTSRPDHLLPIFHQLHLRMIHCMV